MPSSPGVAYGRSSVALASCASTALFSAAFMAANLAFLDCTAIAGIAMALSTPMMTITTSSSTSVKPPSSRRMSMRRRIAANAAHQRHPIG